MGGAVLVSGSGRGGRALPLAAAIAVEAAIDRDEPVLLADLTAEPRPRSATLLASPGARELEGYLKEAGLAGSARGHLCHLAVGADLDGLAGLEAAAALAGGLTVAHLPSALWAPALERPSLEPGAGVLLAELPRERSLAALAVAELRRRGLTARVISRPLPALAARRALAGVRPGRSAGPRLGRLARGLRNLGREERGQALPALLGASVAIVFCALLLTAIGGAITGKARVQRAADLAALSAARSMRDDLPRLLAPPLLPDGSLNPRHLSRAEYLSRARSAAADAARHNQLDPRRLRLSFPRAERFPPLSARARVSAELDPSALPGGERVSGRRARPIRAVASAVAEAAPPANWSGLPSMASGDGYSGPLVYRNGEGMRPDVAAAYDRMALAARGAGHLLVVSSGFRSDAEQARLFAQNPDPRWVAPPGQSLHRCATELDLGPSSAYGWLAAKARRFGFLGRYSWEPWHYGYTAGPVPCSTAGNSIGAGDGAGAGEGLPSFVPARYRSPILRSAARWNVSGALLAAQLMAESGFDPNAVSPAGAQGIAQFISSTAAAYGLSDPFDPVAAIDAQAHLMSRLLRQFRSIPLALAAYNAGPGAVAACGCASPFPETTAYVARILGLLNGAGAVGAPPLEVRLVK
jgi:hypothetical protein